MGNFRFYRRVSIFPGLSVNLSKSGPSLTVGMRGAHMTFGSSGVTRTVGIPGTGLSYRTSSTARRTPHGDGDTAAAGPPPAQADGDHASTSSEPLAGGESGNLAIWLWLIVGAFILWLVL